MNVLIIDDDAEDTALFCEALNELFPRANCTIANSCQQINDTLKGFQPDIIFIDGHMFPISGQECLRKLNHLVDRKRIKIVVHSGSLSPGELGEFEEVGIDAYLHKARTYEELKTNIRRIVVDKYNLLAKP